MGESNEEWGDFSAYDQELADAWDSYDTLPDEGANLVLDSFLERKNIDQGALLRVGAKLAAEDTLAYAYDRGIKYRNMISGRMWSYSGSEWPHMKIIPSARTINEQVRDRVIVCEGETDGARLSMLYDCDVAVMPAGAKYFPETMAEQLEDYQQVLIALDKDEAGEIGTSKVEESHNNTVRFPAPGDGDWSDLTSTDAIPDLPELNGGEDPVDLSSELLVAAGDMLEMEVPDITSWLEHAVLPVGGQLILHGWSKSYKTFLAIDLLARLSQGQDWCMFEPTEEPCRTAVMQFEIPWPFYKERIEALKKVAPEPQLFEENFLTWTPTKRPELQAGDRKSEDKVLKTLVENHVSIVLIDPIRRAIGMADLNAENEVRKMLRFFERLQDAGITVVATHHDSKDGARAGGGSAITMTGSGAFSGDADTIVSVELPKGETWETSTRRNLNFLLRNAAPVGPRSAEMQGDSATILYDSEPVFAEPDHGSNEATIVAPSI